MEALGIFLGGWFLPLFDHPRQSTPAPWVNMLVSQRVETYGWRGGGGLQSYFSSFSCGNFVVDKSCLLLIPVTWYPEYCPASGLACLFHGALEHMGGWRRGGGGIAELFFYFLWKFCRGQILSLPHPVTWYAENYPASGSACLFHSALEHIGPIFLFSVETL